MMNLLVTYVRPKKVCMFGVKQPPQLNSTDPKKSTVLCQTYVCLVKSQKFPFSVPFNETEMVNSLVHD